MSCFNSLCKWDSDDVMQICSRCKKAMYCSRDCQIKDWSKHREICGIQNLKCKYEVRQIRDNYKGLFATEKIYRAETIISEKSIMTITVAAEGVGVEEFNSLYNNLTMEEKMVFNSMYVNDKILRASSVLRTFKSNAIGANTTPDIAGLYPTISICNHSCIPNSLYLYDVKNKVENLIAVKDIEAGDEILCSYLSNTILPREARRLHLKKTLGFDCECKVCAENDPLLDKKFKRASYIYRELEEIFYKDPVLAMNCQVKLMEFCVKYLNDIILGPMCYSMFQIFAILEMKDDALRWLKYCALIDKVYNGGNSPGICDQRKYFTDIAQCPEYIRLASND